MAFLRTLLLVCVCSAPSTANAQGVDWSGRWLIDEGISTLESRRTTAIRAATAELNVVARRIARRRLRRRAPMPHHVSITGAGAEFRALVGDHLLSFAPDGSQHPIRAQNGDTLMASQQLQGRRLRQVIRGETRRSRRRLNLARMASA